MNHRMLDGTLLRNRLRSPAVALLVSLALLSCEDATRPGTTAHAHSRARGLERYLALTDLDIFAQR